MDIEVLKRECMKLMSTREYINLNTREYINLSASA
jgi:hypothetical protein